MSKVLLSVCMMLLYSPVMFAGTPSGVYDNNQWPDERYTVGDNGTVSDDVTGLMWKRCSEGQSGGDCESGTEEGLSWKQALTKADDTEFAGFADWRLPNINELDSIVARDRHSPSINSNVFPGTPRQNDSTSRYWSSTPFGTGILTAWVLRFSDGSNFDQNRETLAKVRLVRGDSSERHLPLVKLDVNGRPLEIQNKPWKVGGKEEDGEHWTCVFDRRTSLYWEVKLGFSEGGVHSLANGYRWGGVTAEIGDTEQEREGVRFADWDTLVNTSNRDSFCGYSDWRVPNVIEAESHLYDFTPGVSPNAGFFPTSGALSFWTSTSDSVHGSNAWSVNYNNVQEAQSISRQVEIAVRLVRGQ